MPRLRFSAARAYAHLRSADPVVAGLIERCGPFLPRPGTEPFPALVRAIIYQQLAGTAAAAIARRFEEQLGGGGTPSPEAILTASDETLRGIGLSRQKAGYLRDLAEKVSSRQLLLAALGGLDDTAVARELTQVKGIGEWSAHMFLMFELGRPDILPAGDFGVRNGMRSAYRLRALPTPARAQAIGAPWSPYRSVGAWYMWRAVDEAKLADASKARPAAARKPATSRAPARQPGRARRATAR